MTVRIPERIPRLTIWLMVGVLVTVSPRESDAQEKVHSFMLRDTAFASNPELMGLSPNTIFTYDEVTGLATSSVANSSRLADALAGTDALVDGFSYGLDIGGMNDHSFFYYSILLTDDGLPAAVPGSPLAREPRGEAEADVMIIADRPRPEREFDLPRKELDENDASGVATRFSRTGGTLGLTGIYGDPGGIPPAVSNVAGLDFWSPEYADDLIFFSIDRPALGFSPADILVLFDDEGTDVIECYRSAESLGLDPVGDDIDGLAFNSQGINSRVGPVGWFSLTRESVSVSGNPELSAADIFQFLDSGPPLAPGDVGDLLHMSAESLGLLSGALFATGEAEIDSIAHIDPDGERLTFIDIPPDGSVEIPIAPALAEGLTITENGHPVSSQQATGPPPLLGLPRPGDYRRVEMDGGQRFSGVHGSVILRLGSAVPPVQELAAVAAGNQITWQWNNPVPNPYENIEVSLDFGTPQLIDSNQTTFTVNGFAPGVYSLAVRGIDLDSVDLRSEPLQAAAEVVPDPGDLAALQPPRGLQTRVNGEEVLFDWILGASYLDIDVLVNGVVVDSLPGTATNTLIQLPPGKHTLALRGNIAGLGPTIASAAEVWIRPTLPGQVLQAAPFPGIDPTGVTLNELTGELYVTEGAGNQTWVLDANGLDPIGNFPSPAPGATGITTDGFQLFWAIQNQLWISDLNGQNAIPVGPFGGIALAGDLAFDFGIPALWVADIQNGQVTAHDPNTGQPLPGVPPLPHPEGAGIVFGVSPRQEPNVFEVTHGPPGGPIERVTATDGGGALASIPLESVIGPEPRGIAWTPMGPCGMPSLFVAEASSGTIYELSAVQGILPPEITDCHGLPGVRSASVGPVAIPGAGPLVLTADPAETVGDLDVVLEIEHPNVGNLEVTLSSPSGTTVTLYAGSLGPGTELRRRLDDLEAPCFNDLFGTRPPDDTAGLAAFDGEPIAGPWLLMVQDSVLGEAGTLALAEVSACPAPPVVPLFRRGDCNRDGQFNIGDPVNLLDFLFQGGEPPCCEDACDSNDDGTLNIGDVVFTLNALFDGGPPPAAPGPATCGPDPTADSLDCGLYTSC